VLDEPTVGLDLVSKERMRAFLRQINADDGVTILLTTHDLPDVERLCRRVVVIDRGRVIADDGLDALRRRSSGPRELVVDLAEPAPVLGTLPEVLTSSTEADGLRWRLRFEPPPAPPRWSPRSCGMPRCVTSPWSSRRSRIWSARSTQRPRIATDRPASRS
jgi:hypothetical protein